MLGQCSPFSFKHLSFSIGHSLMLRLASVGGKLKDQSLGQRVIYSCFIELRFWRAREARDSSPWISRSVRDVGRRHS